MRTLLGSLQDEHRCIEILKIAMASTHHNETIGMKPCSLKVSLSSRVFLPRTLKENGREGRDNQIRVFTPFGWPPLFFLFISLWGFPHCGLPYETLGRFRFWYVQG